MIEIRYSLNEIELLGTIQELNEIAYLDQCIKEALRIYPVAYMNRREVQEDIKIGGYVIPKGTSLLYSSNYINNDERYWKEPRKFMPERFSKEEEETKEHFRDRPTTRGYLVELAANGKP